MLKQLLFLTVSAGCLALTSCSKKELADSDTPQPGVRNNTDPHLCTALYAKVEGDSSKRTTAFGERSTFWMASENIRVKFMNGDPTLQNRVKAVANEWMQHANVHFSYVTASEDSDIRIAFKWNNDGGSWSYVGKGCRQIAQASPTMNFGWFDASTSDEEIRRVTLHEFGHAVGLGHEHQNPTGGIQWNRPVVYDFYARTQGWSPQQVDLQVLNLASSNTTNFTSFDPASIMLYSFPASLTTNGFSTPSNTVLSSTDKTFIGQTYPFSSTRDCLYEGQLLNVDESLVSSNGRYRLLLQADGNLVIYNGSNRGIWNSGTWGKNIRKAIMQADGNFVLYDNNSVSRFSTNTWNPVGSYMMMQPDGNLVIYQRGQARWSSNTWNQRTTAKK
ncbi:matrixin family metalloprotease [Hymenobacter sp. BT559]|uniref:matrixin family metalloprotease n=1 Tax=Hymenobacter sp. BT559 TaxID=2795729 RepID=UPI0018ED55E1|nr:matrixin family metalloprotease [Hymenobacter sp. BT559]MBJ6141774.1 hypothetical protein [Hymenobacter sp. BT559]